jgi:hypothetical protein
MEGGFRKFFNFPPCKKNPSCLSDRCAESKEACSGWLETKIAINQDSAPRLTITDREEQACVVLRPKRSLPHVVTLFLPTNTFAYTTATFL